MKSHEQITKKHLNSDGQQLHQYQQNDNKLSPQH